MIVSSWTFRLVYALAGSVLACLLLTSTAWADGRVELSSPLSSSPPPCLPGQTCLPGALVGSRLVALSPEDAREALVTLRLLDDAEALQTRCAEELAEVRAELRVLQVVPVVVAEGGGGTQGPSAVAADPIAGGAAAAAEIVSGVGGSTWSTRLAWGFGGCALGVLLGSAVVIWAGG